MSLNHGINTYKSDTNFAAVKLLEIGIPFFVGAWPCHAGNGFAGKPQIAYNFPGICCGRKRFEGSCP